MRLGKFAVAWDWRHTLILAASTAGGALVTYFEAEPTATLLSAFQSWTTAKPLLVGAALAAVTALVALAKQTFLVVPSPAPSAAKRVPSSVGGAEPPGAYSDKPTLRRDSFPLWVVRPLWRTAAVLATLACLVVAADVPASCTPAQQAEYTQIEQTVLADLQAGKTLAQIEQDVGQLVAGQPGADVAEILNDALTLLIDLGVIPANILPTAKADLAAVAPIAAAHRAAAADAGAR